MTHDEILARANELAENDKQVWDDYVEHVDYLADSESHKSMMLNSNKCFVEWIVNRLYEAEHERLYEIQSGCQG